MNASNDRGEVINLEKVFKIFLTDEVETYALADIDLVINSGEFIAISGPSGCGKSTLLAILGLLESPSSGRYLLGGREVGRLGFSDRAGIRNNHIGFIFQSFNLIGSLTIAENVALPLKYRGTPRREREQRVADVLQAVGIPHRAKHYPNQLSGGQQQRAAIARALIGKPSILLADEPTGNLDSRNGESIMELLVKLNKEGTTICMVTHDPRLFSYVNRVVHLFDGKIVDASRA